AFFAGNQPTTAQGVIALAGALEQTGRTSEAQTLVRTWWREQSFEAAEQSRILRRWGGWPTQADHAARLHVLLLGPHGPATQAAASMVSRERQAIANTVIALRTAYAPDQAIANLSPSQALDPNVVFERVRILRAAGRQNEAFGLLSYLPPAPSHREG